MNYTEEPWKNEPDDLTFVNEETGLECRIRRHPKYRHLCGYVLLPQKEYPFLNYVLLPQLDKEDMNTFLFDSDDDVHGGITYTKKVNHPKTNVPIFVLGFDCAHAGDYMPGFPVSRENLTYKDYKDINYVKNECIKLAHQLYEQKIKYEKEQSSN